MIILLEYNGVELEVAFNGTKWIEVPNDDGPKNWGSKTYMGSLSAEDVYLWLKQDYGTDIKMIKLIGE